MKFKIVLINFPFDDLITFKLRPALCLTDFITDKFHIVLALISSQLKSCNEQSDFFINDSKPNFNLTGLRYSSVIRLHRLITVSDDLIIKIIGELPPEYHSEVFSRINKLFFNQYEL